VTPIASSGTTADALRDDLRALWGTYITNNINPSDAVYIMNPRTALAVSLMQNPLGQSEFPGLTMNGGTLMGVPVIVSNYVPYTSPGSLVILVNASDIYLADDGQVAIDASREASLQMDNAPTNSSATPTPTTLVSMWQTNSVALRAERYINWAKRRSQAVAYLSGVNWN
jgi:HK97 family phage major capsid protein